MFPVPLGMGSLSLLVRVSFPRRRMNVFFLKLLEHYLMWMPASRSVLSCFETASFMMRWSERLRAFGCPGMRKQSSLHIAPAGKCFPPLGFFVVTYHELHIFISDPKLRMGPLSS